MRVKVSVVAATVCASLAWAATASAQVAHSSITSTSPEAPYVLDDDVTGATAISGSGTTDGTTGDSVDINCYQGSGYATLAAGIPVQMNGSFTFSGSLDTVSSLASCVLRAVPHGDTTDYAPGGSWAFTGPALAISSRSERRISGGLNGGALEDYGIIGSQQQGAFAYHSLGNCSISFSYLFDPVTLASSQLDNCDADLDWTNAGGGPGTRSELQVDGADAYLAGNIPLIPYINASTIPGFPSLSYTYSFDPTTGGATIDESDEVVKCSPGTPSEYPPSSANCTSLVPTGVEVTQHVVQYGPLTSVVQRFSSTDGHSHSVDLLEGNGFLDAHDDGELEFSWSGAGMQEYVSGATVRGPGVAGPGSFYVNGSASVAAPQGSLTFSDPPSSVDVVVGTDAPDSWLELHYTRTIPASGAVALGFTYADAFSAAQVDGVAAAAEGAFRPVVAISSPRNGDHTTKQAVTVSGTASDGTGLSAVTVDGQLAALAANGTWSARVSLRPAADTISATAYNVFGNTSTAQAMVTFNAASLAPRLSHLSQAHVVWREAPGGGGLPPLGTTFGFSLSKRARVTFAFTQPRTGRRLRGRCVAVRGGTRRGRPCKLNVAVATMSFQGHRGHNRVRFAGLVHDRELAPGRYTLVVVATADELVSAPEQIGFTIVG